MPTAELEPLAPAKHAGSAAHDTRIAATDVLLVRRMRAGDERSFEAIFKRHHAPLLSYCRHMLASRDEAEDALQQTFIRAHGALLGDSPPRELRPWLYAIARNCCLSAIAARHATDELDGRTPSLGGLSEEVHEREELRELVTDIARLPEDQRSALLLSELDDLSHRAIATVVGCPVSKVKALVYQARTTLMAEREARGASCRDIREQLSVARGAELRRGPLRRHIRLCAGCRDFQLAVETQRQSLAIVLPVLPSAALAARILGHGALHAAGAAGVGQASAGIAPAAGGAATATATGTSAAAGGGTGIAAAGGATAGTTAATGTTAVAGTAAVGGTSAGAWIGGGALAKVAVGGAVAALATAGAVAIPQRPWHSSRRVTHGTLHRGARSASSGVAAAASGVVANAAFVSADGLSQTSGAAVHGSPAGGLQVDLSGPVSPAGGLEGAAMGALTPPSSSSPSQPSGAGAIASPARASGAIAPATKRRAQARRARLRSLRHRRQLLKRERLLKRRLLLEQRRLRKQRKRRKQITVAKPPAVAPPVATPTHKPARKPKTRTASSPTSSTAPTTAGGTTAKHKPHPPEAPEAGGASQTPENGGSSGAADASGASPAPMGTTPASHKTGKGSGKGSATGAASGTSTGELGSPGASPTGSGETEGAKRKRRPSGAAGGGSANSETSAEELLDASPVSDQPLG